MFKRTRIHNLWLISALTDIVAIVGAYFTTVGLRFYSEGGARLFGALNGMLGVREPGQLGADLQLFYVASAPRIIAILAATLGFLYAFSDLYAERRFFRRRPVGWHVLKANAVALVLFYAYFYARWNVFHPRTVFITILFVNVLYCVLLRALTNQVLHGFRTKLGWDDHRVVLIGSGTAAEMMSSFLAVARPHGAHVVGRVDPDPAKNDKHLFYAIAACAEANDADLLICADDRLSTAQVMGIIALSETLGLSAKVLSTEMDVLVRHSRLAMDAIRGVPFAHFDAPAAFSMGMRLRRLVYKVAAVILLVVLAPLLGLIAMIIRFSSHGPAIFAQERVGINRKPFTMYKFRTMHQMADEQQAAIEEYNEAGDGLFKIKDDPRTTPAGRFLRRFSLDELPQLVNVVRGEMTLVGPRPLPRRDFENYYEDWHYGRHTEQPGITGLWQVSGRSDIDFRNMCILDIYYLRNPSMMLDLKILLKTVWVVLFARGAY